ncbi:MAG: TatD family hydrolase [Verrucomicrobiota bacterium]|nr:TatD family hydrolase [Verrucomicrobiota bacterium]
MDSADAHLQHLRYDLRVLIDTHAHLDYPEFAPDFEEILARASAAGVTRVITIGTSLASSRRAVELAAQHPNVYAVVGVHPTSDESADDVLTPLRQLAQNPRVVAIGETGLDYHRLPSAEITKDKQAQVFGRALQTETEEMMEARLHDGAYKARQASLFEQQLDLAAELNLNVVIHQRDAWEDTLRLIGPYAEKLRGVFHCFGGSADQAEEVLAQGHLVSFTGIVTFKNGTEVRAVAAQLALDQFMVETDCPYLAPVPFRGKRCEPAHTRLVAESIATARGISLDELARATTATAESFFRFNR